jgi:hypothetical protein
MDPVTIRVYVPTFEEASALVARGHRGGARGTIEPLLRGRGYPVTVIWPEASEGEAAASLVRMLRLLAQATGVSLRELLP